MKFEITNCHLILSFDLTQMTWSLKIIYMMVQSCACEYWLQSFMQWNRFEF